MKGVMLRRRVPADILRLRVDAQQPLAAPLQAVMAEVSSWWRLNGTGQVRRPCASAESRT